MMNNPAETLVHSSPFHKGEQHIQSRLGVREKMERFGRKVIRNYLPEQHRQFYQQLPCIFVGHADEDGWPWASLLLGEPGFMNSPDPHTLTINTKPIPGDPLESYLNQALAEHSSIGLLGIDLSTRRRNRLSAVVDNSGNNKLQLQVRQSFGNCPQYIQQRRLSFITPSSSPFSPQKISNLDAHARSLISKSDTFFVSSCTPPTPYSANPNHQGVDISHRGGKPGFIRIDNNHCLTIPDYLGNFHFNTLGNFLENPKAGLLFLNFEHGHILSLSGAVEILWDSPDTRYFKGAERLWQFHLNHGYWLKNALSVHCTLQEYSPNTLLTGSWPEAQALQEADQQRESWLPYRVEQIINESSTIKSFYLSPLNRLRTDFKAGQFLTLRTQTRQGLITRNYTLSSAPTDQRYRISVKLEQHPDDAIKDGQFSGYLHKEVSEGDILEAKAPSGNFYIDFEQNRPAILMGAGVGLTPMVSMVRHIFQEGLRTRRQRPLTLIATARNQAQRAFYEELNEIGAASQGRIRIIWALSQAEAELKAGNDYHHSGRINKELLQAVLPLDDYDVYLCGPREFMQNTYDLFRSLGVADQRIFAESFGPAALERDLIEHNQTVSDHPVAEEAIVKFLKSKFEQPWSKEDGNLLAFAEKHGLTPEFGCRNGQCGTCKTKLVSGKVSVLQNISIKLDDDEILLCCSAPAAIKGEETSQIEVQL